MTNKLQGLTALNHSATVYVPTTNGAEKASPALLQDILEHVKLAMSTYFGGYTVTEGLGGWANDAGELIQEKVYMVRSNSETMDERDSNRAVYIAEYVKKAMKQDLVSIEIDGTLYFV